MQDVLHNINAVVGVTGSFVCDVDGQVLTKLLPEIFDDDLLTPVGQSLAQTVAGLELTRHRKVSDMDLLYRDGRLMVKNLRVGYLCILCVPNVNVPLLNLTATRANRMLTAQIKADRTAPQ